MKTQVTIEHQLSVTFVSLTIVLLICYLTVQERVPNYLRILAWFAEWWQFARNA